MAEQGPSPVLFFDTINAYQRTEALRAAIELDLFTRIAAGERTTEQLAAACQASPRGIRILANYLTTLGFLRKGGEQYELTGDAEVFLNRKSPAYLGGTLEFLLTPQLKESFQQLTAAVRRGGTANSEEGTVSHDNPIWVAFARAMAPMMQLPARMLVDLVGGDRERPIRALDVAAGHGIFGVSIAERYPHAHITALDWPNVLAVASENAKRAGVAERHVLRPGSAFEVDWGGPYDLVLLTNFFHHFDLATCRDLASKAYAALAPRRSGDHAGVHSRRGSAQSALHGLVRADDARDDRARGCLYVRGVPADLPARRLSSQRASRTSAHGAAGGDLIQVTKVSGSGSAWGRSPVNLCFRGIRRAS